MMMYPSELPSDYDRYGFDRTELLEFLSAKGIHISGESNAAPAGKKSEVPEWAKLSKAIKQFALHEAADILIGIDPWDQQWRGDNGEREFSRACATLAQAAEYGDLRPVSTDDHGNSSFNAQDLRAWAESVGLDWCIPSDTPVKAPAPADSATLDRLRQLEAKNAQFVDQVEREAREHFEAENARLVEQVAELQRQLQEATAAAQQAQPVEPEDLPDELSIANIAFRAVTNGYGDELATFRNRLGAYLDKHHPDLGSGVKDRIITVANPDKAPGRKTRPKK